MYILGEEIKVLSILAVPKSKRFKARRCPACIDNVYGYMVHRRPTMYSRFVGPLWADLTPPEASARSEASPAARKCPPGTDGIPRIYVQAVGTDIW